jgi:hypothetical protein
MRDNLVAISHQMGRLRRNIWVSTPYKAVYLLLVLRGNNRLSVCDQALAIWLM